jgi:single-stranded DNA-binding protein
MINSIVLVGRSGNDFQFKTVSPNFNKAIGSIAYQAKKTDPTTWFNVEIVSWGTDSTAQRAASMIKKGSLVCVEGKMTSYKTQPSNQGFNQTQSQDKAVTYWKLEATKFYLLDGQDENKND